MSKQDDTLSNVRIAANQSLVVSRLDRNIDINEFKKLCTILPGKAKQFYNVAKYSDALFKKSVIVGGFDNLADKRSFLNVFKLVFPEYWIQETSKILKFFCLTNDESETDCDWKEYFQRRFKDTAQNIYTATGAEALASDYKLLKNPIMAKFLPLKAIVVEFTSAAEALNALLLL